MEQISNDTISQRVQLAKEVLVGLDNGTLRPTQDSYIRVDGYNSSWLGSTCAPLVEINGYACEVCGCGSLAVAAVRRGLVGNEHTVLDILEKFFDHTTIFQIEAIFMGQGFDSFLTDIPDAYEGPAGDATVAVAEDDFLPWWRKFRVPGDCADADERETALRSVLQAIMQNIVRNDGVFNIKDPVDVG